MGSLEYVQCLQGISASADEKVENNERLAAGDEAVPEVLQMWDILGPYGHCILMHEQRQSSHDGANIG